VRITYAQLHAQGFTIKAQQGTAIQKGDGVEGEIKSAAGAGDLPALTLLSDAAVAE
jgi:hypothetical protein